MHGILVACIAVMAMFLGLFAMSVEPTSNNVQAQLSAKAPASAHRISAKLD